MIPPGTTPASEAFCVWVPSPPAPPPSTQYSAPFISLEPEPGDCKKGRGPKATSAGSCSPLPLPIHSPSGPPAALPAAGAAVRPRPTLMRSGETRAGGGQSGPSVLGGADGWSPDSNRRMRTRWRRSRPRPRCLASPEPLPPPGPASQVLPPTHTGAAPNPLGFGEA